MGREGRNKIAVLVPTRACFLFQKVRFKPIRVFNFLLSLTCIATQKVDGK